MATLSHSKRQNSFRISGVRYANERPALPPPRIVNLALGTNGHFLEEIQIEEGKVNINMGRRTYSWIVVAALLALAVSFGLQHSRIPGRTSPNNPHATTSQHALLSSQVPDTSSNSEPIQLSASNSDRVSSNREYSGQVTATEPSAVIAPHSSRDISVVGQRFAVSSSVEISCNDRGLKAHHICDRLQINLADMSKEPRDTAWATEMEMKLQDLVASQGYDPSSIRNVECRTSWCAIEVASIYKAFVGVIPYPNPLNSQLDRDAWSWAVGRETDPTGAEIQVFVQLYRRR
jgi:hypothetical protein